MSNKITGAEAMIKGLLAEGVDTIFGYPGGAILPFYDKLWSYRDSLRHILTRHEQGAIHAAQGYARASGRTGVVVVTSGPAATNIITGLSDALLDSTPLVIITGQVAVQYLGSDAFQETDVVGITQPISKWAYQIRRPDEIEWALSRAFYIASTGRPGPVVLDFAKDAQVGLIEPAYKPCTFIRSYNPLPEVNPASIAAAADLINRAERPMIIAGHGVMIANAEQELLQLAERADIPVINTLLGLSTIPTDHRLFKGMAGMHGNIGANYNTNRADVIVAIGMRFDDRVTGVTELYAPDAKIVHIDIDAAEFDKNITADVHVHADARQALDALLRLVGEAKHVDWIESFDRHAEVERVAVVEPEAFPEPDACGGKMKMGEVARRVSEATGNRAILVSDVGQNQMLSARYFKFTEPKSIITSGGLGTMGFSLPAAIGAKIGAPERTVCCFTGDGGFQMTLQELGTIMEYGIGVKIIVLNNNFLGNVRQWQELFFEGRFSNTPLVNPDFIALAAAYSIPGEHVATRADLDAAIERMIAAPGSYILDVNIDETDMVFPMTPVGKAVDHIMLNRNLRYTPDFNG